MNRQNYIQDELQGLNSSLPSEANGTPFSVPQGYFEGFAASVVSRIKAGQAGSAAEEIAQLSPFLAKISRKMPFEVPDQYFQTNIEVLPAITSDNEDSLVLSFIEKEMPYDVPKGYFANLPEQALDTVVVEERKVVKMSGRKWMRIAVAAMVAGIIAVSGIVYFKSDNPGTGDTGVAIAAQDIKKELKNVTDKELETFLNNTVVAGDNVSTVNNTPKANDVKNLLDDVSDKELEAFLDQVPTDEDEEDILL